MDMEKCFRLIEDEMKDMQKQMEGEDTEAALMTKKIAYVLLSPGTNAHSAYINVNGGEVEKKKTERKKSISHHKKMNFSKT